MRRHRGRTVRLPIIGVAAAFASLLAIPGLAGEQGGPVTIQKQLADISAKLDNRYVPFKVQISGGLCDSAPSPSSNPWIVIDSNGTGTFVVSSILIKRGEQNPVDFSFLTVNGVEINGTYFETRTGNLFDPLFGEWAVQQAADILGMPVRRGGMIDSPEPGGNVPHQIVADGGTADDIRVQLFCRSDYQDLDIQTVVVSGWKKVRDTIAVKYVPGD